MTDSELIARQAKQIEEQKDRIAEFVKMTREVRLEMCCIGGPLNDNFHQYTKEQLAPFMRIERLTEGMLLADEYD